DETTGIPITNAKLSIKDVSQVTVDQLGRFSIPAPLRKQKWAVVVRAKGYHPKLFEALATRGLQNIHSVQLKKAKTGRLEGQVEYLGKKPESYTVFIDREKYHFPSSQSHFVIDDLIVGQHLVGISGVDDARNFPYFNISVYIREDEPARIDFTIPPQALFAGRVVDEQGRGLKGAYINIAKISVRSEEDGKFRSSIIPAALHKKVRVSHHEFGWSEFGPFDFRSGGGQDDIEFVLRPKGKGLVAGKINNLLLSGQERGLAQLYKKELP
ncbi:MAG: carboxypeptidase-like regulatory domain-containing protein, partial [Planctomycetota bacterium]|nr:carboxypeptidase-like regulatory domain-containing protein [Planctomycetota bacterium]